MGSMEHERFRNDAKNEKDLVSVCSTVALLSDQDPVISRLTEHISFSQQDTAFRILLAILIIVAGLSALIPFLQYR